MALKETALKQIKYLLLCDKMVIFRPACRCASLIFYALIGDVCYSPHILLSDFIEIALNPKINTRV